MSTLVIFKIAWQQQGLFGGPQRREMAVVDTNGSHRGQGVSQEQWSRGLTPFMGELGAC